MVEAPQLNLGVRSRHTLMMRSAIATLTLLSLVSCDGRPLIASASEEIVAGMAASVAQGPGAALSLDSLVRGKWQRVYIFGPYTEAARIERCLGAPVSARLRHRIEARDDVNLLVFEYADRAPASVVLPRTPADFGPEAVGRGYARGQAAFLVRTPPEGSWGELVPARDLTLRCS